ncbi:MAG: hypothetical protein ACLFUR_03980 [Candidatus Hadarchaeia archaeon]
MNVSRVLRILITIIFVMAFIGVTISAYKREERMNALTTLSDASSSVAVHLASEELVWEDERGISHPEVVDPSKLSTIDGSWSCMGENYLLQTYLLYIEDGRERMIGPFGEAGGEKMSCSFSLPVSLRREGGVYPAKLRVILWYD